MFQRWRGREHALFRKEKRKNVSCTTVYKVFLPNYIDLSHWWADFPTGYCTIDRGIRSTYILYLTCQCKGSTFSSVILRPWVGVRPRIEPGSPSLKGKRGGHDTTSAGIAFVLLTSEFSCNISWSCPIIISPQFHAWKVLSIWFTYARIAGSRITAGTHV
jgi:hypothetical protein